MKHLPGFQPEIRLQAIDDFAIRARLDFHAHGRAFAAPVKLRIDGIENAARFFLFEVKVAVARHSKRSRGENLVAVVQPFGEGVDHVVKKYVFDFAFRRRQTAPGAAAHAAP